VNLDFNTLFHGVVAYLGTHPEMAPVWILAAWAALAAVGGTLQYCVLPVLNLLTWILRAPFKGLANLKAAGKARVKARQEQEVARKLRAQEARRRQQEQAQEGGSGSPFAQYAQ
jgi:hypothetical protein